MTQPPIWRTDKKAYKTQKSYTKQREAFRQDGSLRAFNVLRHNAKEN
jgi:hypothetical protein